MPSEHDYLAETLNHPNLQVDDDGAPRPMIAVLDARPGMADQLRQSIAELVAHVRREPGCLAFNAYQARDTAGRFYLYEIYADAAAFRAHLQTDHVHRFITSLPHLSTGGPASLIQLDEIAVP